jgi:hypothetical protein
LTTRATIEEALGFIGRRSWEQPIHLACTPTSSRLGALVGIRITFPRKRNVVDEPIWRPI